MGIIIRNNVIYTNSLNNNLKKVRVMSKLGEYKQEITFLISKKGRIFYNPKDLFSDHEDLLIENKINELDVCRLVYDPNNLDTSFCGIPGIFASMNAKYSQLPFELKSIHLNAIENFIKDYENIVKERAINESLDRKTDKRFSKRTNR